MLILWNKSQGFKLPHMHINHAAFAVWPTLRGSLKRGWAGQAKQMAKQNIADLPDLIRLATDLRPDAKSAERLKMRITGRAGVVRAAVTGDCKRVTFIGRTVREVEARVLGETAFHESGLIYLRAQVGMVACDQQRQLPLLGQLSRGGPKKEGDKPAIDPSMNRNP